MSVTSLMNRTVSWHWAFLSASARWMVRHGILNETRLPTRVIGVGNLQAGGAGKTPLVARIAKEAVGKGLSVAILTRGYGAQWETSGGILAPGSTAVPELCGDEPALLHELCPQAWIGIGHDRVRQFRLIEKELGRAPDLVILDDGFQHWKIHQDVRVLALTPAQPGETLFRDWKSAISLASLAVWTKGASPQAGITVPSVRLRYRLNEPKTAQPVLLITGVADPESVRRSMEQVGYRIVEHLKLDDHARYEKSWVESMLRSAESRNCAVVITGKDWVKWKALGIPSGRIEIVEPELVFESGRENWDRVLWGL